MSTTPITTWQQQLRSLLYRYEKFETRDDAYRALGGVDSKDSLLGTNQIQGFFFGGSLGCDGSFGVERCRMGANGAADHRAA